MKRVLITGASGFVGRQTIWSSFGTRLRGARHRASCHRSAYTMAPGGSAGPKPAAPVVRAVRPDALLHCAWFTKHGAYWEAAENLDWVAASLDLARCAVDSGARRMLVAGSCAEYDWINGPSRPWHEDTTCHPASLYGQAKDGLHRLLTPFAASAGVGLVWARLFHLYGTARSVLAACALAVDVTA